MLIEVGEWVCLRRYWSKQKKGDESAVDSDDAALGVVWRGCGDANSLDTSDTFRGTRSTG